MTQTTGTDSGRRSFMQALGVGATAIGISGILAGNGAAQAEDEADEPAGYLSIVYDDSPIEDFEMFQVHQEYDAPGCVAACPGLMNSSGDWLSTGHLQQMYEEGWEVMSHTIEHRALGEVPVEVDITEGDTQIYVQTNLQGRFEGDPLVVFDEDGNEAQAVVAGNGEDDTGQYIELEEPIDGDFTAGSTTVVRYTDEFTEEIVADSRAQLEEMVGEGQVTNWIYTYERADGFVGELVPDYYDATPREDGVGLNPEYDPDPYDLSRRYMEDDQMDEADIEQFLDNVADEPDYGILAGHSQFETIDDRANRVRPRTGPRTRHRGRHRPGGARHLRRRRGSRANGRGGRKRRRWERRRWRDTNRGRHRRGIDGYTRPDRRLLPISIQLIPKSFNFNYKSIAE